QGLQVRICRDELDAFHLGPNHAIDGIAAATAHADNFDFRRLELLAEAHPDPRLFIHVPLVLLQTCRAPLGWGYDAPANMDFSFDTRFPARCGAARRAFAPYNTSPTTVAYSGWATSSGISARLLGCAMRMGRWKYCTASSSKPLSFAPPPAS